MRCHQEFFEKEDIQERQIYFQISARVQQEETHIFGTLRCRFGADFALDSGRSAKP